MTLPACETCGAARTAESSAGGLCAACLLAVALTDVSSSVTSDSDAFDTLPAGTTLGQFVIRRLLGRGGMGAVYEAHDTRLDRAVALKVLPSESLHDRTFGQRFETEARVIARLEHPNIVPIYAAGIDAGVPWMSMRLLAGDSLNVRLERGPLAPAEVVRVLRDVAAALDYAHGLGVVHRDVKPANILLDRSGAACVADFGLAQMSGTSGALTQTGMITGTPHYMAPEQALGRAFDHRSDIYSLGIVAYEMLVGRTPFTGPSPVAVLLQHAHEPLPPPPGPRSSSPWMDAIEKAAAKDPAHRWSSAGAFVNALAMNVESGQRGAPPSRKVWAGAAAGVLAAIVGLIWAVVHQSSTLPPPSPPPRVANAPQPQPAPPPSNAALPSNDPALPARQRASGSAIATPPPQSPVDAPVATRTDAPVTTPAARVETRLELEPLAGAPGLAVPSPQPVDVVTAAEVIRKVEPAYPAVAIAAELQGTVILTGVIGVDGRVREITVEHSVHPLLDAAARKALAAYEFTPARRNGTPIPWPIRLKVPFTLK